MVSVFLVFRAKGLGFAGTLDFRLRVREKMFQKKEVATTPPPRKTELRGLKSSTRGFGAHLPTIVIGARKVIDPTPRSNKE